MSAIAMPSGIAPAAQHPVFRRLLESGACAEVTADNFDAAVAQAGDTLVFFAEEPARYREVLDLAVILPELVKAFPHRFRTLVALPEAALALQPRYGFNRWPALVMLRGGEYVGVIAGLREWGDYVRGLATLLDSPATRPPSVGIAVRGPASQDCHDH